MHRKSPPIRSNRRGIALSDLLFSIAVLSVLAGIALTVFPGLHESAAQTKLEKDARTLNMAVAAYLNSGGQIPADASADTVLAKLKSSPAAAVSKTLPGLRGSMLDVRLKGKRASTGAGGRRISWDRQAQAFRVTQSGEGWSEMISDDSEAGVVRAADARRTALPFASTQPWVWDYVDTLTSQPGRRNVPTQDPTVSQPVLGDPDAQLLPPAITPASGEYGYRIFPMDVTIQNPNPPGTSVVRYQVDGGAWQTWPGGSFSLSRDLTHNVRAFTESLDGESSPQSNTVVNNYVSYFIRGQSGASFINPLGEARMVQNVSSGGKLLQWGKVESAGQSQSSLEYRPAAAFEAAVGESFAVATLHYTNGVSRAGTNAVSVTASISLPLTVPTATTLTVSMPMRMQNTVHYPWTPASDYNDFLWVPDTMPVAQPIVVMDRIYRLTLYSSAPGSVQDGTDLKIAVGENQAVDVTVTAHLDPL